MARVTGMVRPIDFRYASNRYVAVVTLVAGVVGYVAAPPEVRVRTALAVAGSAFLGWAVARELDPDRTSTALASAPAAGLVAWIDAGTGHFASLGALYLVLATARVLVRTTGRYPTTIDLILHLGLATWLATGSIAWVAGMALGVAIVLDTRLPEPAPARHFWWGAAIGLIATAAAGLLGDAPDWVAPAAVEWVPMAVGITGAVFLVRPEPVTSVADSGNDLLDPGRLWIGRLVATACAVAIAFAGGAGGIAAVGAVWVVLAIGGIMRIVDPRDRL